MSRAVHLRGRTLLAALVCAGFVQADPRSALALTVEDLQGAKIELQMSYDMRIRRAEGEFPTTLQTVWRMSVARKAKSLVPSTGRCLRRAARKSARIR